MQEINILQNSKAAKFCRQNHMNMHVLAFSENNQSFYSIADFFRSFYNVKRAKRSTSRGKIRFLAPDRSKMIHFKIGDPKSWNGGPGKWWKITQILKHAYGTAENHLK